MTLISAIMEKQPKQPGGGRRGDWGSVRAGLPAGRGLPPKPALTVAIW